MRIEEQTWRNKRPIRVSVRGSLGPCGEQLIEMSVIYERKRYVVGYALPPAFAPQDARFAHGELRRAWRSFREGVRRLMHGDNFRDRWSIERVKREQLRTWDKYQAPLHNFTARHYARQKFQRELERTVGPTPPYTGHDYARRVSGETFPRDGAAGGLGL